MRRGAGAATGDSVRGPSTRLRPLAGAVLCLAPCAFANSAQPVAPAFDFLYIEANVGTSSGGHVALRIGDDVFHYQHESEGFIALARDDWPRFQAAYNDRDNRNIHVARIDVTEADRDRVRDRFVHLHLVQRRHLDFLSALRRDVDWLSVLASGGIPEVPGAGFFSPCRSAGKGVGARRSGVSEPFGSGYLEPSIRALERRRAAVQYAPPEVAALDVNPARHTAYPATFSENYQELASRFVAMRVFSGEWCANEQAFLDPLTGANPSAGPGLSALERDRLHELAQQLEQASRSLLDSPRADRGFPQLLAMARLGAVRRSLALDRLILLNPYFGRGLERVSLDASERRALPLLEARARGTFEQARRHYFALDDLDEASLNFLENTAARYVGALRAATTGEWSRFPAAFVLPSAGAAVGGGPVLQDFSRISEWRDAAERQYRAFRDKLRSAYGYDLIRRNCATELIRGLNSAFGSDPERARALGSRLDPMADFAFIPFRLYGAVVDRLRTAQRYVLPSYRNRALAEFSRKENPLWIYLAEATTATSALYTPHAGDTRFLFFTEDLPWLRPLYGAANVGYGLLQASGGLFTAAFDQGERLSEGLRGVLFSLPELAFCNIRKGSFQARR